MVSFGNNFPRNIGSRFTLSPLIDLSDAAIVVDGGDIRIVEIVEEARKIDPSAGKEPPRARSVRDEGSTYCPPGYEQFKAS